MASGGPTIMQNAWTSAPGAWIILNQVLEWVEQELGVTRDEAANLLRGPLERCEIYSEVQCHLLPISAHEWPYFVDMDEPLEVGPFRPMTPPDWDRVWNSTTLLLDDNPVRVSREDIIRVLKDAGALATESGTKTTARRRRRKAGGNRPQGRRPKYDWEPVVAGLGAKLFADGVPSRGDGGQARLEEWVANQFPPDKQPAKSVIRKKVVQVIARLRAEMKSPSPRPNEGR
jgi:hypothetical protein